MKKTCWTNTTIFYMNFTNRRNRYYSEWWFNTYFEPGFIMDFCGLNSRLMSRLINCDHQIRNKLKDVL